MSLFRLAAVLIASLAAANVATSAERRPASVELSQTVLPNSEATYLDLARQFLPDLKEDGTGADKSKLYAIGNVGGPESAATVSAIKIGMIQRMDVRDLRAKRALVLFDLGPAENAAQSVTIVGLYDLSSPPRLLDAMNVGTDLQTSFADPYLLSLSQNISVGFIDSWHLNSGEEFMSTSIVGIWDDKLHAVDTVWARNWEWCRSFSKHELTFRKGKGISLEASMAVSTKRAGSCDAHDSGGKAERKVYRVIYSWDDSFRKLKPGSQAFKTIPDESD